MTRSEQLRKDCEDLRAKVASARRACAGADATERDKSDLQMLEQELIGLEQKLAHCDDSPPEKPASLADKVDRKLDAALKDSFPGSDPVAFVEAAPVKPEDKALSTVKVNEKRGG